MARQHTLRPEPGTRWCRGGGIADQPGSADGFSFPAEIDILAQVPVSQLVKRGVIAGTEDKVEATPAGSGLLRRSGQGELGRQVAHLRCGLQAIESVEGRSGRLGGLAENRRNRSEEAEGRSGRLDGLAGNRGNRSEKNGVRAFLRAGVPFRASGRSRYDPSRSGRLCHPHGGALRNERRRPRLRSGDCRGTGVGACRWLTPAKAMIQLSLRYRWEDHFWFSFYHEAGHLLLHGKRVAFIESGGGDPKLEDEADRFAGRFLIPWNHEKAQTPRSRIRRRSGFPAATKGFPFQEMEVLR